MLTCPNASFTDLAEIVSRIEPAVKQPALDGKSRTSRETQYFSASLRKKSQFFFYVRSECSHSQPPQPLTSFTPSLFSLQTADESEYQTDYDEMLSDFDFSEHTEDETADTGDTVRLLATEMPARQSVEEETVSDSGTGGREVV